MDFFAAQDRALRNSRRLQWLFFGGVVVTVASIYAALVATFRGGQEILRWLEILDYRTLPFSFWQPKIFGLVFVLVPAILAGAAYYRWILLRRSGESIAREIGAVPIPPDNPDLRLARIRNVTEEMAIAAGVPVPQLFLLDDEPAINALVAGTAAKTAALIVTEGALVRLDRDELQALVAHEFGHILRGDVRLNVRLAACVHGLRAVVRVGLWLCREESWTYQNRDDDRPKFEVKPGGISMGIVVGLPIMAIGSVGVLWGRLMQTVFCREREFLADAAAVQFTRNPAAVAGVLARIESGPEGSVLRHPVSTDLAHFFFAPGRKVGRFRLWTPHPAMRDRRTAVEPGGAGMPSAAPALLRAPFAPTPAGSPETESAAAAPVARARRLIKRLPGELVAAAHSPDRVSALVCGLLLDRSPAIRARQHELIRLGGTARWVEAIPALEALIDALAPEERLPLLQMALPALGCLEQPDRNVLGELAARLVEIDGHVSLAEYCVQRMMRSPWRPSEPDEPPIEMWAELGPAMAVLLSALARAGSGNAPDAAFAAGAWELPALQPPLVLRPAGGDSLAELDAALDRLERAVPTIKQGVLQACAATVVHDRTVSLAESELYRTIALVLGCPAPLETKDETAAG